MGAIIQPFPFIFTGGFTAVAISLLLSVFGLFGIGSGVSLTASSPLWKSGVQQILFGLLAAGITFGIGRLIGTAAGQVCILPLPSLSLFGTAHRACHRIACSGQKGSCSKE